LLNFTLNFPALPKKNSKKKKQKSNLLTHSLRQGDMVYEELVGNYKNNYWVIIIIKSSK